MARKAALGADLVIPALALAFAGYFFYSISDLVWVAKANGVLIGAALVFLALVQFVRAGLALARGEGTLSFGSLLQPREVMGKRIGMVVVTIVFIATIPWLGLTLGLLLGMMTSLWIVGVRRIRVVLAISIIVAATAYLLFILMLDANFHHGPIENMIAAIFR